MCLQTCPSDQQTRLSDGRCKCGRGGHNQLCKAGTHCDRNLRCADGNPPSCPAGWFWGNNNRHGYMCVQTCPSDQQTRLSDGRCKCGQGGHNQLCKPGTHCDWNYQCADGPAPPAAKAKDFFSPPGNKYFGVGSSSCGNLYAFVTAEGFGFGVKCNNDTNSDPPAFLPMAIQTDTKYTFSFSYDARIKVALLFPSRLLCLPLVTLCLHDSMISSFASLTLWCRSLTL